MSGKFNFILSALLAVAFLMPLGAEEEKKDEKNADLRESAPLLRKFLPSSVRINYYLKLDTKEREPRQIGNARAYLEEQRPYVSSGFLIAPTSVLTANLQLLPENLDKITVEFNGTQVNAVVDAFYPEQGCIRLKLASELKDAQVLEFKRGDVKPAFSFHYFNENGSWVTSLRKYAPAILTLNLATETEFINIPQGGIILDKDGNPITVAFTLDGKMKLSNSWKQIPDEWSSIPAGDLYKDIQKLSATLKNNLYAVKVNLRRKQLKPGTREYFEAQRQPAEFNVPGLLLPDGRVLVCLALEAQDVVKIERIAIMSNRQPVTAEYDYSFKDLGLILVKPSTKLPGSGLKASAKKLETLTDDLVLGTSATASGNRLDYLVLPTYIRGFRNGWKDILYPHMRSMGNNQFVFDLNEELLAMPLQMRRAPRNQHMSRPIILMPFAEITAMLAADKAENFDKQVKPQPEEDTTTLAWLGIEFQRLTPELALMKNIASLTNNGNNGLMITYIYPGSPAATAGLQDFDVITSLTPLVNNVPIVIQGNDYDQGFRQTYPWDHIDRYPEQMFERLQTPWASLDNKFNNTLTGIGIGQKYRLSYIHDGQLMQKELTVTAAPLYHENAPKYENKDLGLTVNDLTFEVRHHYKMAADEPGVIVSKIKTGSKASVAGIKPYEVIYSINDQPVRNIEDFKKLVTENKELAVGVKRLNLTRIAKLQASGTVK